MTCFTSLEEAIREIFGAERRIKVRRAVSGGDINEAYALTLDDGTSVFLKQNKVAALSNFQAEAAGLQAIERTGKIRTPGVLGCGTDPSGVSFLLLAFIRPGTPVSGYWEVFGRELAAMHGTLSENGKAVQYGFPSDNYIGYRSQTNTWNENWIPFFRDCRLAGQFRDADRFFDSMDKKWITWLLDHLDRLLEEPEKPGLVHGDLWAGNFMTGEDGKAWLIDPAAYYGHPEVDLAMTELFGGFSSEFYDAYQEIRPLNPGYQDRKEIYNLYHLLNHLNMFGRSYLPPVRRILRRFSETSLM